LSGLRTKLQIYRWTLARAMMKHASKRRAYDQQIERRRWNFPTRDQRRASDRV
jgi:hypothetical protein